jgi:hypothetical protein
MSKTIAWLSGWKLLAAPDRLSAQTVAAPQYVDPATPIKQRLDELIAGMGQLHGDLGIRSGGGPVLQTMTFGGRTPATRDDWASSSVRRNGSNRGL